MRVPRVYLVRDVPAAGPMSRRGLMVAACSLIAALPRPAAHAAIEGVPFYAPGTMLLPDAGFETFLPKLERLRDRALPALRSAVESGSADAAAFTRPEVLEAQQILLSRTAALLGDEAYDALALKSAYSAAAKKLARLLPATESNRDEALKLVGELQTSLDQFVGLVPEAVVKQVRAYEARAAKPAAQSTATAPPQEVLSSPETEKD